MVLRWRHRSPTRSTTPARKPGSEAVSSEPLHSRKLVRRQSSLSTSEPMAALQAVLRRRLTSRAKGGRATSSEQPFVRPAQNSPLLALPHELQLQVASYLSYPDALALKHTCSALYGWVNTGVRLKVDWLVWRRSLHLECPNDRRCDLGSDLRFCRGSVSLLMQRRRSHQECHSLPHLGCLVFDTPQCSNLPLLPKLRRRFPFLAPVFQRYDHFSRAVEFWISLSRQGHIDRRSWLLWSSILGLLTLAAFLLEIWLVMYRCQSASITRPMAGST